MIVRLRLKNFRQYRDQTIEFESGLNLITGDNNAGKSTLFYALEYVLLGGVAGYRSPSALIHPGQKGVGVELIFKGKDERTYRLQRTHIRPPRSRTKVVGHFTLKQRDEDSEGEIYLLSSDFQDREEALALKLFSLTGITKRLFETAIHTRQGECSTILEGSKRLDMVLGVTAATAASDEFRAMALECEKSAASKPVLIQTIDRLDEQLRSENNRRETKKKELTKVQKECGEIQSELEKAEKQQSDLKATIALCEKVVEAKEAREAAKVVLIQAEESLKGIEKQIADIPDTGGDLLKEAEGARENALNRRNEMREADRMVGDVSGHLGRLKEAKEDGKLVSQMEAELAELEKEAEAKVVVLDEAGEEVLSAEKRIWEFEAAPSLALQLQEKKALAREEVDRQKKAVIEAEKLISKATEELSSSPIPVEGKSAESLQGDLQDHMVQTAKSEAKLEHLDEMDERLAEEIEEITESISDLEKERADFSAQLTAAEDSEGHAQLYRTSSAAMKWMQTRLRESAASHLSERILTFHHLLSGGDKELTSVGIDPADYKVHVKSKGYKSESPASLFQGGGQRVLLGLAFKLALAEWIEHMPFLLLDEPTDGLDTKHLESMLSALRECPGTNQILMITHVPWEDSGATCHRIRREAGVSELHQSNS